MTQFAPQPLDLNVPLLKTIARQLNKTLTIYDLETTNLVGVKTFGITDVAAVHIHPDGSCTQQSTLIDPENPISEEASKVTGLTQEMVTGQPVWSAEAMPQFIDWMKNHVMLGFNNIAFDNPGVISQNTRYGAPETKYEDSRDVRSMYRILTGTGKGKLVDAADRYGINPEGAHRAIFDVVMTAKVLEGMLDEYGMELFEHPGSKITASRPVEHLFRPALSTLSGEKGAWINQEDRILEIVDSCGYHSTERLALMLGMDKRYCGNLIDAMLLDGRLDYTVVEEPQAQKWLLDRVPHVIEQAWIGANRGKFKPILEAISTSMKLGLLPEHNGMTTKPANVTYTQLKVFLKAQGYMAALEKSSPLVAPLQVKVEAAPPLQKVDVVHLHTTPDSEYLH